MSPAPPDPQEPPTPRDLEGDEVLPGDPLYGAVWINPQRMSGSPCFFGTRVPVKTLFDYLQTNHTVDGFLDDFPCVDRRHIDRVLAHATALFHRPGHAA